MKRAARGAVGGVARTMWVMTFHAACGRSCAARRRDRARAELHDLRPGRPGPRREERLEELELRPEALRAARRSTRRSAREEPARRRRTSTPGRGASFYDQTVARVYALTSGPAAPSNALDFDDLLMLTVERPRARSRTRATRWQKAFRYILIDEYQDTNHAQYGCSQLRAGEHRNICVVGDPDQSIYAWRGADISNILEFEQDYPDAKVDRARAELPLDQPILSAANALIAHNRERKDEEPLDRDRRGRAGPRRSRSRTSTQRRARRGRDRTARGRGIAASSELAIFYRTNAQSRVIEDILVRQDVPYQVIGGPRFYERAEVKDAVAYLQAARQPDRRGLAQPRIVNRPRRGLGDTTLARLAAFADAQGSHFASPRARRGGRHLGGAAPCRRQAARTARRARGGCDRAPGAGAARARPRANRATWSRSRRSGRSRPRAGSRTSGARRRRARVPGDGRGAEPLATSSRASRSSPTRTSSSTRAGA